MKKSHSQLINAFIPTQTFNNSLLTGSVTFGPGSSYTIDTTGLECLKVDPITDSTYFYASNTSAVYPMAAGTPCIIWLLGATFTSGTIQFGTAATTSALQGM